MMRTVRAEALTGMVQFPMLESEGDGAATLEGGDEILPQFWGLVLIMAVRDQATSLHYHPWRNVVLTYIVAGTRYELIPPPAEAAPGILAAARALFAPPTWFGRQRLEVTTCGSFEFDAYDSLTTWDAVVWSSGERAGVELYRVSPPLPEPPPFELPPDLGPPG